MSSSIRRLTLCFVSGAMLLALASCQPRKPLPESARPLDLLARPMLEGASFDPSAYAGKVVLVNFWSPSCGYCVRELPDLQRVADELGPRGLELVTVVTHGNYERARAIVERAGLRAPVVISDGALQDAYKVDVVPWTVVIGKDGRAVDVVRGGQDGEFFRRLATRYL
jgi:thiol-disulfide isomerase/thioredoxin